MARALGGTISDSLDTSSGASLPALVTNWTIAAWVKRSSTGRADSIWSRWGTPVVNRQLFFYYTTSPANKLQIDIPYVAAILSGNTAVVDTDWHHCVARRNGNVWNIFLDGVIDGTATNATGQEQTANQNTQIGSSFAFSNSLLGSIAEVAAWSIALTDDEIAALAKRASPSRIQPLSLEGYWPLQGLASPEPDLSGKQVNLTVTATTKADHAPVKLSSLNNLEQNLIITASKGPGESTEKYVNNVSTTLNGAIGNTDITLIVISAAAFPSTPQFRLLIESEIILVTGIVSNTFNVIRGAEGTTAASHADGLPVTCIFSKGVLDQTIADIQKTGTNPDLPTIEKAGRIYKANNSPYEFRDNGTIWESFGPKYKMKLPPAATGGPSATQFGWVNQNSATVTSTNGNIYLQNPANTGTTWTFLVKTIPATPFTLTVYLQPTVIHRDTTSFGLILRKSSDGTFIAFMHYSSGDVLRLFLGNGNSGPTITTAIADYVVPQVYSWMRISDDGTTRSYWISSDGNNWLQFAAHAHTAPLVPDQIGIGQTARNASFPVGINLMSWLEQ